MHPIKNPFSVMIAAMLAVGVVVQGDKDYMWLVVAAGLGSFFGFLAYAAWKEK
jgi:hypothetical protein